MIHMKCQALLFLDLFSRIPSTAVVNGALNIKGVEYKDCPAIFKLANSFLFSLSF